VVQKTQGDTKGWMLKWKIWQSAIVLLLILLAKTATAQVCDADSAMATIRQIQCELESASPECKAAFQDFGHEAEPNCTEAKSSRTQLVLTGAQCAPIVLAVGISTIQSHAPGLIRSMPALVSRLGSQFVRVANWVAAPLTVYTIGGLASDALKADEKCSNDTETKFALLLAAKNLGDFVADRANGLIATSEAERLRLPEHYLEDKFVRNLTCRQLNEIVLQQKSKTDEIIGPLIASGQLSRDPRKELPLNDEDAGLISSLSRSFRCFEPEKQAQLLCAVGTLVIGFRKSSTTANLIEDKPVQLNLPSASATDRLKTRYYSRRLSSMEQLKTKGIIDNAFISKNPRMAESINEAYRSISAQKYPDKKVFLFSESNQFDKVKDLMPEDPALRTAIKDAYNKLIDPEKLAEYTARLMRETTEFMANSKNQSFVKSIAAGKLEASAVTQVLEKRTRTAKENVGVLDTQYTQIFQKTLARGPFIDKGFTVGSPHGQTAHLLQLDFTRDVMLNRLGENREAIFKFLATPEGNQVWEILFDADRRKRSPTSPEGLNRLLRTFLPLD